MRTIIVGLLCVALVLPAASASCTRTETYSVGPAGAVVATQPGDARLDLVAAWDALLLLPAQPMGFEWRAVTSGGTVVLLGVACGAATVDLSNPLIDHVIIQTDGPAAQAAHCGITRASHGLSGTIVATFTSAC